MKIVEPNLDKIECFIGPTLQISFADYYDLDERETQKAIDYYRERFKEKGMFENKLYSNIPILINSLKVQGFSLIVATSKPTIFAEQILKYFNIDSYFDLIVGSHLDGTRASKTEIIQYILDQFPEHIHSDFIMVWDRKHDIIEANNTGIDSIGVTYGYGSMEELRQSNPTHIVESVDQLKAVLLGSKEYSS